MSDRTVTHATFTIERHYDASPARVFFDGLDTAAAREHGTRELLESLATVLASADQQG